MDNTSSGLRSKLLFKDVPDFKESCAVYKMS